MKTDLALVMKFGQAVGRQWLAVMSGGALTVALSLYERISGASLSLSYYAVILTIFIGLASFGAWKDQRLEHDQARQRVRELEGEPNVTLELSETRGKDAPFTLTPIRVYNTASSAFHILIEPVSSGEYKAGTYVPLDGGPPQWIPSQAQLRFDPVPELHGDSERLIFPHVRWSHDPPADMLKVMDQTMGLWWFLDKAVESNDIATRDSAGERSPVKVPLTVTDWNHTQTRRWRRVETLHYDISIQLAYITHGIPRAVHEEEA